MLLHRTGVSQSMQTPGVIEVTTGGMLHGYNAGLKGVARFPGIPREDSKSHDNSGTPQNLSDGLGKPSASQNTILAEGSTSP